ncbi:TPA: hypothetical protein HA235_00710 [Candidatus Woesearchaeota archaeon]|nr:hypothetical protein [Candidatus Woesearchaeota archaeon]HIH31205.1 hypothetical protein [Candidatus Woesearchaeota archaeon]HIH55529.1 hypothetical protein [Candidatus Woesearchaeota archaeon]HIJ01851.1 hypothetical protein [Candidatus Woesearchaeota archaeon]HIJ13144.1 hypothetical protein [Candidatus Woesearchaeota archaeon]
MIMESFELGDICHIIRSHNYLTANFHGLRLDTIEESCVGILEKKYFNLFGISITRKAHHIANLYFNDRSSLNDFSKIWKIEVFGRENYTSTDSLILELLNKYDVRIFREIMIEDVEKEYDFGIV